MKTMCSSVNKGVLVNGFTILERKNDQRTNNRERKSFV